MRVFLFSRVNFQTYISETCYTQKTVVSRFIKIKKPDGLSGGMGALMLLSHAFHITTPRTGGGGGGSSPPSFPQFWQHSIAGQQHRSVMNSKLRRDMEGLLGRFYKRSKIDAMEIYFKY